MLIAIAYLLETELHNRNNISAILSNMMPQGTSSIGPDMHH
jgi:hypothetical protein